jgi:hypothetical protein
MTATTFVTVIHAISVSSVVPGGYLKFSATLRATVGSTVMDNHYQSREFARDEFSCGSSLSATGQGT